MIILKDNVTCCLLILLRIRIIDGSPSYAEINTRLNRKAQLVFNELFFPSLLLLLKDEFLVTSCFQETATVTAITILRGYVNDPSIEER